jgi:enoyl-CoA hydratase/carnithine racemase
VLTEARTGALWIVVDRPVARNALTFAMYDRIAAICREANEDGSVKAVVISGSADAFVAGTDIAQFVDFKHATQALDYERRMDSWLGAIEDVRVPTIAALRGPVVGGGLAIAAACDLRIAAPSARFGVPVARTLGNCFSAANLIRLAALVGLGRVKELVFTARLIDAQEARAIGLVTEVVESEDGLEPRVDKLVEQLASYAPLTLHATKEMVRRIRARMLPDEAADLVALCYTSADFREGVRAFIERRKPVWTGS